MNISTMFPTVSDLYTQTGLINLFEDHLTYFRNHADTTSLTVDAQKAEMYTGDLYGLLALNGVPIDQIQLAIRMNYYKNSSEYRGDKLTFLIPPASAVVLLANIYKTQKAAST